MVQENEIQRAEVAVALPSTTDAGLIFIGRIHTPMDLAYGDAATGPG
jgi:hypothetical protein